MPVASGPLVTAVPSPSDPPPAPSEPSAGELVPAGSDEVSPPVGVSDVLESLVGDVASSPPVVLSPVGVSVVLESLVGEVVSSPPVVLSSVGVSVVPESPVSVVGELELLVVPEFVVEPDPADWPPPLDPVVAVPELPLPAEPAVPPAAPAALPLPLLPLLTALVPPVLEPDPDDEEAGTVLGQCSTEGSSFCEATAWALLNSRTSAVLRGPTPALPAVLIWQF